MSSAAKATPPALSTMARFALGKTGSRYAPQVIRGFGDSIVRFPGSRIIGGVFSVEDDGNGLTGKGGTTARGPPAASSRLRERKARIQIGFRHLRRRQSRTNTTLMPSPIAWSSPFTTMAIGLNVTEIPDSEDEPMTSSPVAVSNEAVDTLCAATLVPAQDTQDKAFPHQAPSSHIAKFASRRTNGLDANRELASVNDVETSQIRQIDLQPNVTPRQEGAIDEVCYVDASSQRHSTTALDNDIAIVESDQTSSIPSFVPENDLMTRQTEKHIDNTDDSSRPDHVSEATSNFAEKEREHLPTLQNIIGRSAGESSVTEVDHVPTDNSQPQTQGDDDVKTQNEKLHFDIDSALVVCPGPCPSAYIHSPFSQINVPPVHDNSARTEHMEGAADVGNSQINNEIIDAALGMPIAEIEHPPTQTKDGIALSTSEQNYNNSTLLDLSQQGSFLRPATEPPFSAEMEEVVDSKQPEMLINNLACSHIYPNSTAEATVRGDPSILSNDMHEAERETKRSDTKTEANAHETNVGTEIQLDKMQNACHLNSHNEASRTLPVKRALAEEETTQADKQHVEHRPTNANVTSTTAELKIGTDTPFAYAESELHSPLALSQKPAEALPNPTPRRTPQEVTLAELKAQKAALLSSLANLPAIQVLVEENDASAMDMSGGDGEPTDADIMAAANKIVKEHIKLLHEYNELKDIGQGLMGLIADQRGVRIVEIQDEFGIDAKD